MTLTITGASGFVGRRLVDTCVSSWIQHQKISLRDAGWARSPAASDLPPGDTLVHLAAIAHSDHSDEEYVYAVNRDLAVATGKQARERGYRHFIFLSSALVWGSRYEEVDLCTPERPDTAYGRAKLEAEEGLRALESSDFGVTILRPPLVFGPGVKGNLARLLRAVHRWPVCPLGIDDNRRSLLHVDNLAAAILHVAKTETVGTFSPVDNPALSTFRILSMVADLMPKHGRIVTMPRSVQRILSRVAPGAARRLLGSFVITGGGLGSHGFVPPFSIDDGFSKMVAAYLYTASEYTNK